MQVLKNLLSSEKGVFCLALIIAASVLAALGHMTIEQWIAFTEWIAAVYVGGKAIQGAAAAYRGGGELEERLNATDEAVDELVAKLEEKESKEKKS